MVNKSKTIDTGTETKILRAAKEIFHVYGFQGARMQQIADKAGINKALLHYYFRDKKKLFNAVFTDAINKFFPPLLELVSEKNVSLFDKIRKFVDYQIQMLKDNTYIASFIVNEFNQNPDKAVKLFSHEGKYLPKVFIDQVNDAKKKGLIIDIEPFELIINIVSLNVFPILNKQIMKSMFSMSENKYNKFLDSRKKTAAEFIIRSIRKK